MLKQQLKQHVSVLCQSERVPGSKGYIRTQAYLCDQITRLGYRVQRQGFRCHPFGSGLNIFAETGPAQGERIVIGAHYESLSRSGLAADDNASAVAVTLELLRRAPPELPLTFVFFDMEENFGIGPLKGSKAFVRAYAPPVRYALIFDLIGGALMPGFENAYFQFGPGLPRLRFPELEFFHLPMRFLEPIGACYPRSDYHSFRQQGIPFAFISTGTPWYYHTPSDIPARLNVEKMAHLTQCILASLSSVRSPNHPADWSQFEEVGRRILAVPAFQESYFRKMARLKDAPGRLDMLRLYFKVLPRLKKLGPDLWK